MVERTNQRIDNWGRVVLDEQGLLELFYKGIENPQDVLIERTPEVEAYNQWCQTFDATDKKVIVFSELEQSPEEYHASRQANWLIPQEYLDLDVESWLYAKCENQIQIDRVKFELELFEKHKMYDVLRLFIYITETLRANDVWWGVGRGSSVSSYCLFLIGVHKVDSIKYDLDIKEFIRD